MNCLNRLEIQRYIDKEASREEMESFTNHMQNCAQCRSIWETAKIEVEQVNQYLSFIAMDEQLFQNPTFKSKPNTFRKKWIFFSSAAASVLIMLSVFLYQQKVNAKEERIARANMEIERSLYNSDPNKLWNEKQSIITITDEDGNLIYSNITD